MKKRSLILFVGIVITFFLGSCSKSCDCQLTTRLKTYEVNYSLKSYANYGVSNCYDLANYLKQAAWEDSGGHINVSCTESNELF